MFVGTAVCASFMLTRKILYLNTLMKIRTTCIIVFRTVFSVNNCRSSIFTRKIKNPLRDNTRALDKREYLVIIMDNFCKFCIKNICYDPSSEPSQ